VASAFSLNVDPPTPEGAQVARQMVMTSEDDALGQG